MGVERGVQGIGHGMRAERERDCVLGVDAWRSTVPGLTETVQQLLSVDHASRLPEQQRQRVAASLADFLFGPNVCSALI